MRAMGPMAAQDSPTPPKDEGAIVLTPEQQAIHDLALAGQSLFLTGAAGTGKSVLLRSIIRSLQAKHDPYARGGAVAVTAPTGIAGQNIAGGTIHSWAGIGLGSSPLNSFVVVSGVRFVDWG